MILQVKRRGPGPGELNLSFLTMITSTVISLIFYITAALGTSDVENRDSGLLQLKILIPNFHIRNYYRLVV